MKYKLLRGRFNRFENGKLVCYKAGAKDIIDLNASEAKMLESLIGPVPQGSLAVPKVAKPFLPPKG